MRVALVHDWLIHMRGGEKVLEALAELYPDATVYTLFYNRKKISPALQAMIIKPSFLHYLPGVQFYYRWLLPLFPWVIKTLKINDADLVISSSHCVAKAVTVPPGALHVCYCHTPMRYLWGFEDIYFDRYPGILRSFISWFFNSLRKWDVASNRTVDQFIANSKNVSDRIQKYYGRDSVVIHPPVDTSHFRKVEGKPGTYYLAVSHFVPYKRIDLVIEAFNDFDRLLLIVGAGPMESKYRRLRQSEKIFFLGPLSNDKLREMYSGAQALIFPAEEDFGIVPVEAQACGTPVIAYGKGGSLETVQSGVFFKEQVPESVRNAVLEFEQKTFNKSDVARKAEPFDKAHFKTRMKEYIESIFSQKKTYAVS